MGKRKLGTVAVGVAAIMILVVVLMMVNGLRQTVRVTLPEAAASLSPAGSELQQPDAVVRVEVTTETVQAAIETLKRPRSYVRVLAVERLWSGGSGYTRTTVAVSGGLTRADTTESSGRVRHTITDGETTYIWYDADRTYYAGSAGDISPDQEQSIPTYEDILALDTDQIAQADYRAFLEEDCIYVETAEDSQGYVLRYWVSVASGLLIGAEKLCSGETVYRMGAQPVADTQPTAADFTLPDGTVLLQEDG